jgi:Asp-tRNA(Asn)/Glu-tRNA(Gln) amidotransferase A subunit family amidase
VVIHITVPCGRFMILPVGFSFFGPAYSEPKLISIAYMNKHQRKGHNLVLKVFIIAIYSLKFTDI